MTKSLLKNTFREIKNTKARFISIMAIIALGVGFFAGIKATVPSMYNLAESYCNTQNLMNFRLVSTVGFTDEDINAVKSTNGVSDVMPSYFCDIQTTAETGGNNVRLIAVPKKYKDNSELNQLVLKEGRLPKNKNEIVVEAESISAGKYKIGDKIEFSNIAGKTDVTTQINSLEYTVVGKVNSPLYISYQRGTTTIGNGKIKEFMYAPCENFAFERYTELYVRSNSLQKYETFSDEYKTASEGLSKTLETTANARCEVFNTDVIDKAKSDLDKAKSDFKTQKADAQNKLNSAKTEIENGQKTLDSEVKKAQQTLDNAKKQIENGTSEFEYSKANAEQKLAKAKTELAKKETELQNGFKEYNSSKKEFENKISSAQAEIDLNKADYNKAYGEFKNVQEPYLLSSIEQTKGKIAELNEALKSETDPDKIAELSYQLAFANGTLNELQTTYNSAVQKLDESKAQLDHAQNELNTQKQENEQKLKSSLAQLNFGKAELEKAKQELAIQEQNGKAQISSAEQELKTAQAKYDEGVSALNTKKSDGQNKLNKATAEYEKSKKDADKKFADAQRKIDDAQEKLDNLSSPTWYVFDRNKNPGFSTFSQNADRLGAVATVFPLFFLLVAILVCVTTMTRLIEEKRTEIATLKALGYGNFSIVLKFAIYSSLAGILGSIIGIAIGVLTLPFIIYNAYKIMYYIGDISLLLDTKSIILGISAAVLCTIAVTVFVCLKSLHSKPAQAMRPKAPKPGKRILLEQITPLWKRLSFTSKLTTRNLFRYKSRLCMTVIGVAGCTALIVAAFGLHDSFDKMTYDQFYTIYKYNAVVVPSEANTEQNLSYLEQEARKNGNIKDCMLTTQQELVIDFNGKQKTEDTYLAVMQRPDEVSNIISLHNRLSQEEYPLTDDGVLINEKLSDDLGIKNGDTIKLTLDEKTVETKVCGIYEQYVHNYVYMTPTLYKSLFGKEVKYQVLDIAFTDYSQQTTEKFSTEMLKHDDITAVVFTDSSIEDFKNMLKSLNMVVAVMIICAALLALVVLYNLTNINIAERKREIATFKVLGFNNQETSRFIYRENFVLLIIGIVLGLILGIFLSGFIVRTVEVDNVMFGRDIHLISFVYATLLTLVFSTLVSISTRFKIKAVDMIESLKSVE